MSQILLVNLSIDSDDSYTVGPLTLLNALRASGIEGDFYDNLINDGLSMEEALYYEQAFHRNLPIENSSESTRKIFEAACSRVTAETQVIGFCVLLTNVDVVLYYAREFKNRFPQVRIVLGGPHMLRLDPQHRDMSKFPFIDFYVKGRAEDVVAEVLKNEFRFGDLRHLDGLCFKEGDAWHVSPTSNEFLTFEPSSYHLRSLKDVVNVSLSVGCPYKCTFCQQDLYYKEYIRAPVEKCIEILKPHRGKNVFIADALLNASHVWLKDLCEEMIRLGLDIKWRSWFRVAGQLRDISYLEMLYDSGLRKIDFGLESASGPVLKHMMKYHNEEGNYEVFNNIRKLAQKGKRMGVGLNILVGYPTETERDFMKTYNFILFNRDIIHSISSCNIVAINKDSRLYSLMEKSGEFTWIGEDNWATRENTPAVRFERHKRMLELFKRLKIDLNHSHSAIRLQMTQESDWAQEPGASYK